jgi:1-acyl-sn-glycerol-3-phosphate acyltransferase
MGAPTTDELYPFKAKVPAPIYWMYRGIRTVMYAITFSLFWTFCVLVGWLWLPIVGLWPGSRVDRMRRLLRSVGRGFGVFHFMLHLFRLFHRQSPIQSLRPTGTPVVLVANHPTLVDVTAIVSLFPNVVAVARSGFMGNPLLARVIRICGFVPATTHVMQDCEQRLREGFDVLVFPEGTRSPLGGPLHPFHRGAFELAARAKVPLVLLKLSCTPPALSKRLPIWKAPDRMPVLTIEAIETIYPEDTQVGSREMCRAIEQRYQDLMGYPGPAVAAPQPLPLGDLQ